MELDLFFTCFFGGGGTFLAKSEPFSRDCSFLAKMCAFSITDGNMQKHLKSLNLFIMVHFVVQKYFGQNLIQFHTLAGKKLFQAYSEPFS